MSAPRRAPRRRIDGVLLLDKPSGVTSNAALSRVKRLFNAAKAGHTGTLDPLASGLLPVCFGAATRFAQFLLDAPKRYVATIRFGVATTTQDAEGEVVATKSVAFSRDDVEFALSRFIGTLMQTPPAHSALKHAGRPHYEYARRGIDVPRVPREVTIHALRLLAWQPPDAVVDVSCSKGTYVRALAADLGDALGPGAHLAALRRTASGGFDIAGAITIEELEAMDVDARERCLVPQSALVAHLPALRLARFDAQRFLHGAPIPARDIGDGVVGVFDGERLIGIADVVAGVARPRRTIAIPVAQGLNFVEK